MEDGEWQQSKTYLYANEIKFKCEVCGGVGHEFFECPTKRKLDTFAKHNGDALLWGQWKYQKYYKNVTDDQKQRIKEYYERRGFGYKRRRYY